MNIRFSIGRKIAPLVTLAGISVSAFTQAHAAAVVLNGLTSYTESFDSIATTAPAGWSLYTGANATGFGSEAAIPTTSTDWSNSSGAFKNFASAKAAGLVSTSSSAEQLAATDRALGIRQTGAFGDPGAAFAFNFNSTGVTVSSLSFDLMMLTTPTANPRSTTWSIQYAIGAEPTSFTTLATWSDPGVFGSTLESFSGALLAPMSDQSNVWIRIVALTASSGSGSRDSMAIDNFSLSLGALSETVNIGAGTTFTSSSFGGNAFTPTANAIFNGAAQTINLSGAVTAGSLKFVSDGYTLAGSTSDSINVTGTIDVAESTSSTISGKITGTSGLTKSGTGTLVLSGDNDYVGTTNITAGKLVISADSQLGAASNGISLGGDLATAGSMTIGAGRTISGSGGLDVSEGNTLTVNGNLAAGNIKLTNSGNVVFAGTSKSVSELTLQQASNVAIINGALTITNALNANQSSGTSTITGDIALSGSNKDIVVSGGTLMLNGALTQGTGASVYLIKKGSGTLDLTSATTSLQGLQLGIALTTDGGILKVDTASDLGISQIRLNYGMIETNTDITTANTVSYGGREGTEAGFQGAGSVTVGDFSFYSPTGVTGAYGIKINTTTTIGALATAGAENFIVGGTGKLNINGSASAFTTKLILADTANVAVNSGFGGGVDIGSGTRLSGVGTIAGAVHVFSGGSIAPGNSIGTLTTGALTVERGSSLFFELGASGVSDKIVSTGTFGTTGSGTILLDFGGTGVSGGIYTLLSFVGLDSSFTVGDTSPFSITGLAAGLVASMDLSATDLKLVIAGTAIPEPSTYAAILGAASLAYIILRRRKVVRTA